MIYITAEIDETGWVIVSSDWPSVYGDGATLDLALEDYAEGLIEYAARVAEGADCGDPDQEDEAQQLADWGLLREEG